MKKNTRALFVILALSIIILLLFFPQEATSGAKNGLVISSSVIIPVLFPFSVATVFAVKINLFSYLEPIEKIFKKTLGLDAQMFSVMILSFLGGYPIGSKLINELYKNRKINKTQCHYMLCFCVNGGPAFIISAIGTIMLNSKQIGIALFFSHILASLLIAFFCSYKLREFIDADYDKKISVNFKNAFSYSIIEASDSIIKVCAFVIFFSSINEIIFTIIKNEFLRKIFLSLEVTNAVANTENIYLIAFWLGFSGINIWCQVLAITTDCSVNIKLFVFSRFLHGILNYLFFNAIVHIFNIKVQTFSSNINDKIPENFGKTELSISLLVLIFFLIVCIENKNKGRKLKEDLI